MTNAAVQRRIHPSGVAQDPALAAYGVDTFAPDSFTGVTGSLSGGTLASLSADDGNRLAVTGRPVAEMVASRTIPAQSLNGLRKLRIDFDGQTANGRDSLTPRAFDWTTSTWQTVFGPATGVNPDRRLTFDLANPGRYVSRGDRCDSRCALSTRRGRRSGLISSSSRWSTSRRDHRSHDVLPRARRRPSGRGGCRLAAAGSFRARLRRRRCLASSRS
jgi:hypothetical protein